MPNAALIAGRQTVIEGLEGGYDAFSDTSHKLRTRTGSAPLERGTSVTDHAVAEPIEVTLSGVVSDLTMNGEGRAREAWTTILKNWKEVNTFRVVTPFVVYPEMIIAEIDAPEAGFGFNFTLKMVEIQIVGREEQVPSFQALAPAKDRQPASTLGTVANVGESDIAMAVEDVKADPPLKRSNNPLDWLRDANNKANDLIGSLNDNTLISEARELNGILSAPIFQGVNQTIGLNSAIGRLDGEVGSGRYTLLQSQQAESQLRRAVDFAVAKTNQSNEQRNTMLIGYVENNVSPGRLA